MMLKVNNHIFISPDKYQLTEVKKMQRMPKYTLNDIYVHAYEYILS